MSDTFRRAVDRIDDHIVKANDYARNEPMESIAQSMLAMALMLRVAVEAEFEDELS